MSLCGGNLRPVVTNPFCPLQQQQQQQKRWYSKSLSKHGGKNQKGHGKRRREKGRGVEVMAMDSFMREWESSRNDADPFAMMGMRMDEMEDGEESGRTDMMMSMKMNDLFSDPFERLFEEADQEQWQLKTTTLKSDGQTMTKRFSSGKRSTSSKVETMFDPFDELMNSSGKLLESESALFFTCPGQKARRAYTEQSDPWSQFSFERETRKEMNDMDFEEQIEQEQFELMAEKQVLSAMRRDDHFKGMYGDGKINMGDKMCNFLSSTASKYNIMELTFSFKIKGKPKRGTCTYQLHILRPQFRDQNNEQTFASCPTSFLDADTTALSHTTKTTTTTSDEYQHGEQVDDDMYYQVNTILVEDYRGDKWNVAIDNRSTSSTSAAAAAAADTETTEAQVREIVDVHEETRYGEGETEGVRRYMMGKE